MSASIRDVIAALAIGTIVYRIAIANADDLRSYRDEVSVLQRLYRLRELMGGTMRVGARGYQPSLD
jgi:hypothetical protein